VSKQAAGILVFRQITDTVEVLLVHLAGPMWAKRDCWSIPKGELDEDEDHLEAAFREFEEELGSAPPVGELIELGSLKSSGNKMNYIWAIEGDFDVTTFKSNTFTMEWPPKSGQQQEFLENDRAAWFDLPTAKRKLFKSQIDFIDRLAERLAVEMQPDPEQQSLL